MLQLTDAARRENALALAAAAGLTVTAAGARLDVEVLVTHDPTDAWSAQLANETAQLLQKTVSVVRTTSDTCTDSIAAELVIGNALPRSSAAALFASVSAERFTIARQRGEHASERAIPALLVSLCACYACAALLDRTLGDILPYEFPECFVLPFEELGVRIESFERPIFLDRAYLAGAGAIGNAVLWAARHVDLHGELIVADDDVVESANLNRQLWFEPEDIGQYKSECLARRAQPFLPSLKLVPEPCRLQSLPQRSSGAWLDRLLVAVDSRRARRDLQNEFPREVFDASTTDIREVVSFYSLHSAGFGCLSCIYQADEEEYSREQHIADHLGISVGQVRSERIDVSAALRIAERFAHLTPEGLVGLSYDSLFKRLCGEGELKAVEGRRHLAPFAFVSALAGVILVIDLVRRLGGAPSNTAFNYWRLSAWHPPIGRQRRLRYRQQQCAFCSNDALIAVGRSLWDEHNEIGVMSAHADST